MNVNTSFCELPVAVPQGCLSAHPTAGRRISRPGARDLEAARPGARSHIAIAFKCQALHMRMLRRSPSLQHSRVLQTMQLCNSCLPDRSTCAM